MSSKKYEDCEEFSQILLERRIALGFSKPGIAERLGVSESAVTHWEGGVHRPPAGKMSLLAKVLQMPERELKGEVPLSPKTRAVSKMNIPALAAKLDVLIRAAHDALDELRPVVGRNVGGSPTRRKTKKKAKRKRKAP